MTHSDMSSVAVGKECINQVNESLQLIHLPSDSLQLAQLVSGGGASTDYLSINTTSRRQAEEERGLQRTNQHNTECLSL